MESSVTKMVTSMRLLQMKQVDTQLNQEVTDIPIFGIWYFGTYLALVHCIVMIKLTFKIIIYMLLILLLSSLLKGIKKKGNIKMEKCV